MKKTLFLIASLIAANGYTLESKQDVGRYQIVIQNGFVAERVVYSPGTFKIDTVSGKSWVLTEGK